ncbi:PAS domain-containing sensor histidine kinase [Coleofasciculus sp.]|uniref:PAS domain-containing sensor histidine kinase n=1 Tax=Coleofasciculus sp. TaxID=3100458 RepID=UPI0039F814EF
MISHLHQSSTGRLFDANTSDKVALETLYLDERILGAASCGIILSDASKPDMPIVYCNPAFETITGYSRKEVIGRNCHFLQGADTDPNGVEQIRQALRTQQDVKVVLRNYRKDGTPFWNELAISPIRDAKGHVIYFIGVQTDITSRKQAQEELQISHALLKAQQEADPDGVIVIAPNGRIISHNSRFCQMWQIPHESVKSSDKEKLLECMLSLIAEPLKVFSKVEYLEQNPNLSCQDEIQLTDGRFFERYAAPVLSPTGEYYGRIWSFRDITERKQTEQQLKRQAKQERLLSCMNQRINQSLNLDEVLKTAVEEVRKFLTCDRTLIYRFNPDWTGTVDVESVGDGWMRIVKTTIEDDFFKEDEVVSSLYQDGYIRVIDDIYNANLTPCHIKLLETLQVRANVVAPILQGKKLWGLLVVQQCSGVRQWQQPEIECVRKLSIQLSVAIQQAALFEQVADELKERKAAESALRESEKNLKEKATQLEQTLHELKQTQLQLVQSEKMSSLGQLVAGVAHEINNPITFISGNIAYANQYAQDLLKLIQLYDKHYPKPVSEIETLIEEIDINFLQKDFSKLLSSMKVGVTRLQALVGSLKNFSRLDEAERKCMDIEQGMENTLLILQHRLKSEASNIQVVKEYGKLPPVECYPGQLNQVFMNLLNNAIDALNSGDKQPENTKDSASGELSLPDDVSTPTIWISTELSERNSVLIHIADNGSGIHEEVKEQIFDPFFTTKPVGEGTGLGLSISYQIVVEKHGGELHCFSAPGCGTEFVVEIPFNGEC